MHFDLKGANLLLGYRDRRPVCKARLSQRLLALAPAFLLGALRRRLLAAGR